MQYSACTQLAARRKLRSVFRSWIVISYFYFSPLLLGVEDTVLLRGRTRCDPGPGPGVLSRLVLLPDTPRPPSLWDWLLVREVDLGLTWLMLEMLEDLLISLEWFLTPS